MTLPTPIYTPYTEQHTADLIQLLDADRVSARQADRDLHSRDQSFHPAMPPHVVVWATTTEDVQAVLRYANAQRLPVTAWGAGSSLEGNPLAVYGGIMLDLSRMNKILAIRPEDFQVDVEPGVTRIELNQALAQYGLFFPPDPGANATIGGMVANNASGAKTIKYGATKDNVIRLEAVLANGEAIQVGTRARKNSSGYDLLHLMIGSGGQLGIITHITLKLTPAPQHFSAVLAAFNSIDEAMQSVVKIMHAALAPSALEFVDTETIAALKKDKGLDLIAAPTLLIEFNGANDSEGLAQATAICQENGAIALQTASGLEARNRLWEARHHTYESLCRLHPQQNQLIMDVAVPISKYPQLVIFANEILTEHQMLGYKFGHAGDGNLHINLVYDPLVPAELETARHINAIIVEKAIDLEGTASGEHGVGIGKRAYMPRQYGASLDLMRQIKTLFDPHWILNPGKLFL